MNRAPDTARFDVAVVGAGVVGCAIAMELSRYTPRVALLEARSDIGAATSKANSAILHTGFDAPPGSLELQLVRAGYRRFHEWSSSLGLPIARCGALVVAWTAEQVSMLSAIVEKAVKNGVNDLRPIGRDELRSIEPHLDTSAINAVMVPGESITCPFSPPLAFATTAVLNGVDLRRDFGLQSVRRTQDGWVLQSSSDELHAGIVVNAAGLGSDTVDRLFGKHTFSIRPRKGEFLVFDKPASRLINRIILPVPTARTKGVLVARTVFGNLLLGPTAIDVPDKNDTSVSSGSLQSLLQAGRRMLPELVHEEVTTTYAGLRAATEYPDYQIGFYPGDALITVGGIRSTGLSASLGISAYVVRGLIDNFGLSPERRPDWRPHRAPPITDLEQRVCEDPGRIHADPDCGRIVCHCEYVSKREILDALGSAIPARDLDGVKRRTRALLGRCQGFNCHAGISALLAAHGHN